MANHSQQPSTNSRVSRLLWRCIQIPLVVYLIICLLLMIFEERLVFPAPDPESANWSPANLDFQNIEFKAEDNIKLHGWLVEHSDPQAYILFMHGNGEDVARLAPMLRDYRERFQATIFAFDYRGYGKSEGSPNEAGILLDAEAALQKFTSLTGAQPNQIVLYGRSLGGGVAVHLAGSKGAKALVLERTFSHMVDAAAQLYWWAPVRLLMRNRFDSLSRIGGYEGPVLQSHGDRDRLIPIENGQELFVACRSNEKQFITLRGVGHNGPNPTSYLQKLEAFLQQHGSVGED